MLRTPVKISELMISYIKVKKNNNNYTISLFIKDIHLESDLKRGPSS